MRKNKPALLATIALGLVLGLPCIQPVVASAVQVVFLGEGSLNYASDSHNMAISGNGKLALLTRYNSNNEIQWANLWGVPGSPSGILSPIWNYSTGPFTLGFSSPAIDDDGSHALVVEKRSNNILQCFGNTSNIPLWNYTASSAIYRLVVSKDGRYVVAGGASDILLHSIDGSLIWRWATGSTVQSLAVSRDGSVIVTGLANSTVVCFGNTSNSTKWRATITGFTGGVRLMALSDDGLTLAVGGYTGTINVAVLDATSGALVWNRDLADYCVGLAISSNGSRILVSAWNEAFDIAMFSRANNQTLWQVPVAGNGEGCSMTADGSYALMGSSLGNLYAFHGANGQVFLNFSLSPGSRVTKCVISNNGNAAGAISATGKFVLFRIDAISSGSPPSGDPLDTLQWILIAGLAVGLVISLAVLVKRGRKP